MPANNYVPFVYEREPLLLSEEDAEVNHWTPVGDMDGNGNRLYEADSIKLAHIPETGVQLYPEHIESKLLPKFPKERRKAVLAMGFLAFGLIVNSISIVLTHQKIPDRNLHPPLPDISLDFFTKHRWLNDVADILVIICLLGSAGLIVFHSHRWIVCRRVCLIMSLLYTMRSFTMYSTVLPLANTHVYCSPKLNSTFSSGTKLWMIAVEVTKFIGAGGLPITGKKTLCGDYIFSGHTIIFMISYLLVREYVSRRYRSLHWISCIAAWLGMICLLISHGHYTIDVIIGYYATTRLFWMYHLFANNTELQKKSRLNPLAEVWWFSIFKYFEGNVKSPLPKEYSIPKLPRRHIKMKLVD